MSRPIIDVHTHIIAFDPQETDGGWVAARLAKSRIVAILRRVAGLPAPGPGFDNAFRAFLTRLVADADAVARAEGLGGYTAVGLAFDHTLSSDGEPNPDGVDFFTPNSYVRRFATESVGADSIGHFLFGASIHPFRHDALAMLHALLPQRPALVKWLPTTQDIDPADPRSIEFARECARLNLPLLVHTGSEALRNSHPEWNNPRALEPLLDTGATVIAGHAGMRSLPHEKCHFHEWIDMLPHWPNLYGDTAAIFGLRPRALRRGLDKGLTADRLVHGSDWPVPNWAGWYWPVLPFGTVRRLARIGNPFWRDVAAKRALGVPDAVFFRGWDLVAGTEK